MARYALNLPIALKQEAAAMAKQQGISLNQFILWAVADKVASLRHLQHQSTLNPPDNETHIGNKKIL